MKRFVYNVKGLRTQEAGEKALSALSAAIPESTERSYSAEESSISFSLNRGSRVSEERLAGALAAVGLEIALPEGVKKYRYVGEGERPVRKMPVAIAVSLISLAVAASMIFTFVACSYLGSTGGGNQSNVGNSGVEGSPIDQDAVEELEIPQYIKDLIKLDDAFNDYSYDGLDEESISAAMLKAYIAATGDMYAEYMTKEEYDAYNSESAGEFVGIGISIINSSITISGYTYKALEVISVFKDSPALESGVKVGDFIVYAGGGEGKTLVDALGYDNALSVLLGEAGTVAEFTVYRPDNKETSGFKVIDFAITRRKVTTESVTYRVSETNSKVGIVHISSFDMTTAPQFTEAVDTLLDKGCEKFVFDVRNNPGGALLSIEAVLSYFLDEGDLIIGVEYGDRSTAADYVQTKNYGPNYAGFNVTKKDIGKYKDLDFIVITNENTASAAELFTATMRDYELADIVGMTTYGKGCMQTILPLDDYGLEGGLRVTTAMYFSKSKHIYHNIGIVPDIEVELSEEAMEYNFFVLPEEKDNQLQTAIAELLK